MDTEGQVLHHSTLSVMRARIAELEASNVELVAALSALHCHAAALHDWVSDDIQPGQNVPPALTDLYHQMRFARAAMAKVAP